MINLEKNLFDERVAILADYYRARFYPSYTESLIYENKKLLAYWLEVKKIPHPKTWIFFKRDEADSFIKNAEYPLISKINIGASGKGVTTLNNYNEASNYIKEVFTRGIRPYIGPSLRTGTVFKKLKNIVRNKGLLKERISAYRAVYSEPQRYAILQEYVEHSYEWRVVAIGKSFFAHKKLKDGVKASGSLLKEYSNPPLDLLDFVRILCREHSLSSVSMDIFETPEGYLVNEIQTYFGQSDSYQMKVDGVIGRYIYRKSWEFEEGDFARNQCYNLRLEHLLEQLKATGENSL